MRLNWLFDKIIDLTWELALKMIEAKSNEYILTDFHVEYDYKFRKFLKASHLVKAIKVSPQNHTTNRIYSTNLTNTNLFSYAMEFFGQIIRICNNLSTKIRLFTITIELTTNKWMRTRLFLVRLLQTTNRIVKCQWEEAFVKYSRTGVPVCVWVYVWQERESENEHRNDAVW